MLPRVWSSFWIVKVAVFGILVSGVTVTLTGVLRRDQRAGLGVLVDALGQDKELEPVGGVHLASTRQATPDAEQPAGSASPAVPMQS